MNINFDKVKNNDYIKEEGTYTVSVKDFKEKTVNVKDEEKVVFDVTLETAEGSSIKTSFWTGESDLPKMKKFFEICGLPVTGTLDVIALFGNAIGKTLQIKVAKPKPKQNLITGELVESPYVRVVYFDKA